MVLHSVYNIQEKGLSGLKELRFHYLINLNMGSSVHKETSGKPEIYLPGKTHGTFIEKCVNALSGIL